jgi:integrase
MTAYLREYAKHRPSAQWIADMAAPILHWWGDKTLAEINGKACRDYIAWRTSQPIRAYRKRPAKTVSRGTARHELSVLRAAIRYYAKEYGLNSVPIVSLPEEPPPRTAYLTQQELAERLRKARRQAPHLARLILLGLYTGSRPGILLRLRWVPATANGHCDLDRGIIYRVPPTTVVTRKRAPPCAIHRRLMTFLRYWRRKDLAHGITHVVHYQSQPINRVKRSWATLWEGHCSPHIMRHTSATLFMQSGQATITEIAGFLGMSEQTLLARYGHHHPDFQRNIATISPKQSPRNGLVRAGTN